MDMAKNKILLKNAFIHPITQIPFHGDLLIENGKILDMGPSSIFRFYNKNN